MMSSLEHSNDVPSNLGPTSSAAPRSNDTPVANDFAGSPSQEANSDPAPTRHAPTTEGQRVFEKSKYESSTPYQSPKGDRFS
ncbi:putative SET domain-containing protein [Rosellinia necatrix]|uniref:Putative SET domain-containing protein n=1 Tax=Rosellinia necatrix TaxID=77044 RepID=A0A1W2THG1_ROSNE|nr:putative SET domain-containing protein [Rosellinia necatrix]